MTLQLQDQVVDEYDLSFNFQSAEVVLKLRLKNHSQFM